MENTKSIAAKGTVIMRLAMLVNDFHTLVPSQTTAMLAQIATQKGHTVAVFTVKDISMGDDDVIRASVHLASAEHAESRSAFVEQLRQATPELVNLEEFDVLLLRTNPSRDQENRWAHNVSSMMAGLLKERGVLVLNDPHGLFKASNKLYLSSLPQSVRPRTLISCQKEEIRTFVSELNHDCVLKPLQGTRGRDVFFMKPGGEANLNQIIDVLTRDGFAMVQECLPNAEQGDIRVVVMDGELLTHKAGDAAIHRVPGKGELRSNIHTGGYAQQGIVTDAMRETIDKVGPILKQDGIFLAGLDFIGSKLVEVNVFSTGGLRDAERFTGHSFTGQIIDTIVAKVEQK
jgi:glutathione synthase